MKEADEMNATNCDTLYQNLVLIQTGSYKTRPTIGHFRRVLKIAKSDY